MGVGLMELTPKQTRFVAEYLIDGNGTQAAIRAGYAKGKTAEVQGSRLLRNAKVFAAIKAKQGTILDRLGITAESVLAEVKALGKEAREIGQLPVALRAQELLGKACARSEEGNPFAETIQINATTKSEDEQPVTLLQLSRELVFAVHLGLIEAAKATPSIPDTPLKH